MINVSLTQQAEKDQLRIAIFLRKEPPGGNDEEATSATRIIGADDVQGGSGARQLRRLPESGPVKVE
jgi:hypothetical protein